MLSTTNNSEGRNRKDRFAFTGKISNMFIQRDLRKKNQNTNQIDQAEEIHGNT